MPRAALLEFRQKYPQYDDIADQPLAKAILEKYPQYQSLFGDIATGTGKAAATSPSPGVLKEVGGGLLEGVTGTLEGLAQTVMAVPSAPKTAWEEARRMVRSPALIRRELLPAVGTFGWGMVPFSETIKEAVSGHRPTLRGVSREAAELAASLALPEVLGLGKRAIRYGVPELPGSAVELHALAIPKARALPSLIRPTEGAVKAAYDAMGDTVRLDMSNFRAAILDLQKTESALANPDHGFLAELHNFLKDTEEGWSLRKIKQERERMGAELGQVAAPRGATPTETPHGPGRIRDRELRRMLEAMSDDEMEGAPLTVKTPAQPARVGSVLVDEQGRPLRPASERQPAVTERAPTDPSIQDAVSQLRLARRLARRDFAANGLQKMIDDAISVVGDQFDSLNVNRVIDKLKDAQSKAGYDKKAKLFVGSFNPGELKQIIDTLREIGHRLPRIPPMRGQPVGSSGMWMRAAVGELAAGTLGAGGEARMIGAGAGVVVPMLISQAMMTDAGRAFLRYAISVDPSVGQVFRQTMAAFLRSQASQTGAR